jgi:hypothetical protein
MLKYDKFIKKIILILLVIMPVFFPFAHREHYLVPYDVLDQTGLITLLYFLYFLTIMPYWYVVGVVFARWVNNFIKAFFLANLPVFLNGIGETIYYYFFHIKQGSYPIIEYVIGSHIDKFNIEFIQNIPLSIFTSMISFFLFFFIGYSPQSVKRKKNIEDKKSL